MENLYTTALSINQQAPVRDVVISRLGYGFGGKYKWPARIEASIAFQMIIQEVRTPKADYWQTNSITILLSSEMEEAVENACLLQFE